MLTLNRNRRIAKERSADDVSSALELITSNSNRDVGNPTSGRQSRTNGGTSTSTSTNRGNHSANRSNRARSRKNKKSKKSRAKVEDDSESHIL